jgi:hypothetical protein
MQADSARLMYMVFERPETVNSGLLLEQVLHSDVLQLQMANYADGALAARSAGIETCRRTPCSLDAQRPHGCRVRTLPMAQAGGVVTVPG